MATVNIYQDNQISPLHIYKGQHVSFAYMQHGAKTMPEQVKPVNMAEIADDSGAVLRARWVEQGGLFGNRLVTRTAIILNRMTGVKDPTYSIDPHIASLRFLD